MAKIGRGTPKAMRLFEASVASPDLTDMIKNLEVSITDQVHAVLEFVRKDELYFLKSYTDVEKPPRYQKRWTLQNDLVRVQVPSSDRTGWRPAHPGGWADVSDDLRKKYYTRLDFVNNGWRLTIGNNSEHAVYVEAMDGYFVVHGVLEPNGPVARSIKKATLELGIKWKFTAGGKSMADNLGTETSLQGSPRTGIAEAPTMDLGGEG